MPEFYRKHLGEKLQNQIWLVTHSDALLREAVGKPGFNVYHMFPCSSDDASDQLRPLKITEDLDHAMADLVGDLAAYRPGGTAIIFEGGGDSDFDQRVAGRLFPEMLAGINLLSGSNKARVNALHEVLDRAYSKGDLPIQFYAIVDGDSDERETSSGAVRRYSWNVYHLENYLLEPEFIARAVNTLEPQRGLDTEGALDDLRSAARNVVPKLMRHKMREYANQHIVGCFDLNFDPAADDISTQVAAAVERSLARAGRAAAGPLTKESLSAREVELTAEIERAFADGTWKDRLPGRDILRAYRANAKLEISYEGFRNLIVSQMSEAGHEPQGMKDVLQTIVDQVRGSPSRPAIGLAASSNDEAAPHGPQVVEDADRHQETRLR